MHESRQCRYTVDANWKGNKTTKRWRRFQVETKDFSRGTGAAINFHQLHDEDQARATRDLRGATIRSVGNLRGDVHFPLVPLDHHLHRLRPALDNLVGYKGARPATGIGVPLMSLPS